MKNKRIGLVDKTFFKFVLVGCVNTIVGTLVMFISYNIFLLGYWISSILNYVVGSIVSYLLNKHYTFEYKKNDLKTIIRYIINISICYVIAYGLAKPAVIYVMSGFSQAIQENGAMGVGMVLFVILNYIGQRHFAFKK